MKDDQNNEQPTANPAGPSTIALCPCGAELPCNCSYSPPSDYAAQQPAEAASVCTCKDDGIPWHNAQDCPMRSCLESDKPAEAVSEAAREAASELQSRARYEEDLLTDGEVKQIIQRAITAATAAQQAEIAALRSVVNSSRCENQALHEELDALTGEVAALREELNTAVWSMQQVERARGKYVDELAATRECLVKCEASFETIRDRVSDVINRIEHDLTGDLDGDVAFEFDELLELLTKALAAQPLDGGAK